MFATSWQIRQQPKSSNIPSEAAAHVESCRVLVLKVTRRSSLTEQLVVKYPVLVTVNPALAFQFFRMNTAFGVVGTMISSRISCYSCLSSNCCVAGGVDVIRLRLPHRCTGMYAMAKRPNSPHPSFIGARRDTLGFMLLLRVSREVPM